MDILDGHSRICGPMHPVELPESSISWYFLGHAGEGTGDLRRESLKLWPREENRFRRQANAGPARLEAVRTGELGRPLSSRLSRS
jgi:hypothetical protein